MSRAVPVGDEVAKAPRRKSRKVTRAVEQRSSTVSAAELNEQLDLRTREFTDAREQLAAISKILRVISLSPGELTPIFDMILAHATQLCAAKFGVLNLYDNEGFRCVAVHNSPPIPEMVEVALEMRRRIAGQPGPGSPLGQIIRTKQLVHLTDLRGAQAYIERDPLHVAIVEVAGARTLLAVPMLIRDELVGAILIYSQELRPFTDKRIDLIKNFASQAVIAIQNARLLGELRQRTADLTEALERQTATAEVLGVISRSKFELQPILQSVVDTAARLCRAGAAVLFRLDGGLYRFAAGYSLDPAYLEIERQTVIAPGPQSVVGRAAMSRQIACIDDAWTDPLYAKKQDARIGSVRSMIGVPLMREGEPIGVIGLARDRVEPFAKREIELATTFADQAAIAIENVRLFDEIQDKSRQLAEASQHKSRFLANMSHELRTPLNAILGYSELILDNTYGDVPEKMREVLGRIERNGKHLLGLINDVLDLSKIEAGQLTLFLADYSLDDVVHNVHTAVAPLAAQKNLGFEVEVATGLPRGHGDAQRLTQVLLNLVGNAIKFTDSGEVRIKAAAADGSFSIDVCDTGPGISADDQAKLFQEFQQGDNTLTRRKGGTGLGLAISKRIVEMHGGRIWVVSFVGRGSTFSLTLPVAVERQAAPS
jgi:signal transduction histidine kinase